MVMVFESLAITCTQSLSRRARKATKMLKVGPHTRSGRRDTVAEKRLLQYLDRITDLMHDYNWEEMKDSVPLKFYKQLEQIAAVYDRQFQRGVKRVGLAMAQGKGDKGQRFLRAMWKYYALNLIQDGIIADEVQDLCVQKDHDGLKHFLDHIQRFAAPRRSLRIQLQKTY